MQRLSAEAGVGRDVAGARARRWVSEGEKLPGTLGASGFILRGGGKREGRGRGKELKVLILLRTGSLCLQHREHSRDKRGWIQGPGGGCVGAKPDSGWGRGTTVSGLPL